jgi:hypothetical protein
VPQDDALHEGVLEDVLRELTVAEPALEKGQEFAMVLDEQCSELFGHRSNHMSVMKRGPVRLHS